MLKLTIIAIFLYVSLSDDCQSKFKVERGGLQCKISFIEDKNVCSSSRFDKCEIEYCASTSQIASNPSKCSHPISYIERNFQNCLNFCCRSEQKQKTQYLSIKSCSHIQTISNPKKQIGTNEIIKIICIALGVALILIIASYCIIVKCRNRQIHFSQNPNPQAPQSNNGASCKVMDQISLTNLVSNRKWEGIQVKKDDSDACTICLCEGPNLKLNCGHYFHPRCFRMWIKKKLQCGVCRSKELRKLQVICEKCFKNKTIVNLKDFVYLKDNYEKLSCC